MASTTPPGRGPAAPVPSSLTAIGVGIDTARYGHCVSFLRPDRQPAAPKLLVLENRESYDALRRRLEQLHQQHPQAHLHVRIDAAGQYARNLERWLRDLPWPMTISLGEPKRNRDYQLAHFPKRQTDETESLAMARFGVVETPAATPGVPEDMLVLREVAGRLHAQTKQATQAVNRLHNLLARVFPELAHFASNFAAAWVLDLLTKYPSAAKIGQARLASLEKIPHLPKAKANDLHQAAQQSVGTLRGDVAETLVRELASEVRHSQAVESKLSELLAKTYAALKPGAHAHLTTIPGIGAATAAVLTANIIAIDRFATPEDLVGYFGIFPEEHSSGVDKQGRPLPVGTLTMSPRGNDLVRAYLWMAALSGLRANPALRALYRRLKAKGKRGDVALGHCMRKLLHLVYAVWQTDKPFDPKHYPWLQDADTPPADTPPADTPPAAEASISDILVSTPPPVQPPAPPATASDKAVGHNGVKIPARQVVTTAPSTVDVPTPPVNTPPPPTAVARPKVDFAFLRQQITLEQVLQHLGILGSFKGRTQQRRGPCPVHDAASVPTPSGKSTCSVHLGKNIFQCFQADCAAHGNVLDLWAAVHHLPLYEAALHLAANFRLARNREEEPVWPRQHPKPTTDSTGAVITTNGP